MKVHEKSRKAASSNKRQPRREHFGAKQNNTQRKGEEKKKKKKLEQARRMRFTKRSKSTKGNVPGRVVSLEQQTKEMFCIGSWQNKGSNTLFLGKRGGHAGGDGQGIFGQKPTQLSRYLIETGPD